MEKRWIISVKLSLLWQLSSASRWLLFLLWDYGARTKIFWWRFLILSLLVWCHRENFGSWKNKGYNTFSLFLSPKFVNSVVLIIFYQCHISGIWNDGTKSDWMRCNASKRRFDGFCAFTHKRYHKTQKALKRPFLPVSARAWSRYDS